MRNIIVGIFVIINLLKADNLPPTFLPIDITEDFYSDSEVYLEVQVMDQSTIKDVILYYRFSDEDSFTNILMEKEMYYVGEILASEVESGRLEYYFFARDEFGNQSTWPQNGEKEPESHFIMDPLITGVSLGNITINLLTPIANETIEKVGFTEDGKLSYRTEPGTGWKYQIQYFDNGNIKNKGVSKVGHNGKIIYDRLWTHYYDNEYDNEEIKKQRKEILKINQNLIYDVNDYFNKKYNTHVDWIIKINLIEGKLSTAGKRISKLNILSSPINSDIAYGYEVTATKVNQSDEGRSLTWVYSGGSGLQEEVEGELEEMLFDNLLSKIQDFSFGSNIGTVASILDSNLVTIKLKNLDIIKGTEFICLSRTYDYSKGTDSSIEDNRKKFIDDSQIIYNYLFEYQDEVEKLYNVLNLSNFDETTSDYLKSTKDMIDSLKYNYQKFIDEFPEDRNTQQSNSEFRYFLKVLNVQDSIATAKITGSVFPFAYPQVGDEINIK